MAFEFKHEDKSIVLEWGTFSMKRFCEFKNFTIGKFIEWLSTGDYTISDIVMIIQAGAEHGSKGKLMFTDFEICEWIDNDKQLTNKFMKYIIEKTITQVTDTIDNESYEKKTLA